jgi:hypothetical protein
MKEAAAEEEEKKKKYYRNGQSHHLSYMKVYSFFSRKYTQPIND